MNENVTEKNVELNDLSDDCIALFVITLCSPYLVYAKTQKKELSKGKGRTFAQFRGTSVAARNMRHHDKRFIAIYNPAVATVS
ncbi:unnamed protein product [Gongylonema pulchrum]|uniref:Transmembrane protein n=1 Tax=Gongylonema pulchrum TaxID=637853 RepID=A0A183DB27_9BILA|nr:unnamed protein product [Gongylonema pulchrum]